MQWLFAFGFWIFLTGCSIADTFGEWEYVVENGEATITGYTGSGGAVIIPEELNGIPVGQIGRNWPSGTVYPWATVFGLYNTSLISLVLPNNVKKIGDGALSYCYELTSVTFGSGLTDIFRYAFQFCPKLPAAKFSYGLNTVGFGAFMNCSSLVTISLPASVTSLGSALFENCTALTRVEFLGNPPTVPQKFISYHQHLVGETHMQVDRRTIWMAFGFR